MCEPGASGSQWGLIACVFGLCRVPAGPQQNGVAWASKPPGPGAYEQHEDRGSLHVSLSQQVLKFGGGSLNSCLPTRLSTS